LKKDVCKQINLEELTEKHLRISYHSLFCELAPFMLCGLIYTESDGRINWVYMGEEYAEWIPFGPTR